MKFWVFHIILAVTLCAKCSFAKSQSNDWRSYLEQLAEEGMDDTTIENMFQELTMLEGNPMNLNRVSREQLEQFPLINYEQAAHIADFLDKNRPVYTVYELRNVSYLDFNTVKLILLFFSWVKRRRSNCRCRKYLNGDGMKFNPDSIKLFNAGPDTEISPTVFSSAIPTGNTGGRIFTLR